MGIQNIYEPKLLTLVHISTHVCVWEYWSVIPIAYTFTEGRPKACLTLSTETELYYKQQNLLLEKIPNRVNFSSFSVHADPPLP